MIWYARDVKRICALLLLALSCDRSGDSGTSKPSREITGTIAKKTLATPRAELVKLIETCMTSQARGRPLTVECDDSSRFVLQIFEYTSKLSRGAINLTLDKIEKSIAASAETPKTVTKTSLGELARSTTPGFRYTSSPCATCVDGIAYGAVVAVYSGDDTRFVSCFVGKKSAFALCGTALELLVTNPTALDSLAKH